MGKLTTYTHFVQIEVFFIHLNPYPKSGEKNDMYNFYPFDLFPFALYNVLSILYIAIYCVFISYVIFFICIVFFFIRVICLNSKLHWLIFIHSFILRFMQYLAFTCVGFVLLVLHCLIPICVFKFSLPFFQGYF